MSFVHPTYKGFAFALGLLLPATHVTVAFAQGTGTSGGAAPAGGGGVAAGGVVSNTSTTFFPGGVAPPPPGATLGGGNAEYSSSKPITGNERDGFDFKRGGSGSGTVRGSENSSFVLGGGVTGRMSDANVHVVRRGDTLWGISDSYFHNPYQWPRIWSYNPQIQNPNWIYPGDLVRLRAGVLANDSGSGSQLIDRRRQVPAETVFLRNQGYIEDESSNWGEINGSREDKMILTDFDEVYLRIASQHELKIGQELTVFRPVRTVGSGKVIEIQGTVKIDHWNPKERIARARVTETLDAIERGARVGPITRRFEIVPPVRNDKDVESRVVASVQPQNLYGQHQVVFVDQGEEAGLRPGNRLLVVRKGDAWHQSLSTASKVSSKRIALEDDSPAALEEVPAPRDAARLPEEVMAELRVVNVRKQTALCIVTSSRRELEAGDKAVARRGY